MFSRNRCLISQNGQALLIIVLVMVVALTVGLAVATRTVVNLRNTNEQAGSQKALAAAEAGVEQALKNNTLPGATIQNTFTSVGTSNNASYQTVVAANGGSGAFLLNNGQEVSPNNATYIWVTPYSSDPANAFTQTWSGRLTVYWGGSGSCNNSPVGIAALEVSVIYGAKDSPKLKRYAFDPCAARVLNNYFISSGIQSDTTTFSGAGIFYSRQIDLSATPVLLIRVNPVYTGTVIGVSGVPSAGNNQLPNQGKLIVSTGTSGQNIKRKITVFEGYPEVPAEFFPYNLFEP
jgi:Tfp pilus assembly protein PilX